MLNTKDDILKNVDNQTNWLGNKYYRSQWVP